MSGFLEITIDPMTEERVIDALKELRVVYRNNKHSKYYFALGYAIKKYENKSCEHDYSGGNYSSCSKCGELVR